MKTWFYIYILSFSINAFAQQTPIPNSRSNSKEGLNVFETEKDTNSAYDGVRIRVGGNFTQDYQGLDHENNATAIDVDGVNINQLVPIKDGFNLAMANLNLNALLADGIRMELTMYLSSRHHAEAWVKGGFIQFDKLHFLHSPFIDKWMRDFTIKIGDYEVDYGDQHYRRTDGGNAIFNPFVENNIMDQFTTEIGGDLIYHPESGALAVFGITNGQLNPTVLSPKMIDPSTGEPNKYKAAFHGKVGFDKQFTKDVRFRLTGSFYLNQSTQNNTLFFGDRAGSHYFFAMENTKASASGNAWSGRYNPQFTQEVVTFMFNPFVKYKGLELFGTYEIARGRQITEIELRNATQIAADIIYRFPHGKENFWIAGRYNSVSATLLSLDDIDIDRMTGSVGWFITPNILTKLEYVSQAYKNFPGTDLRSEGKFKGFMLEASVGF